MTKVVVLLDGSAACERAVKAAQEFASLLGADVTLLKVLDQRDVHRSAESARREAEEYLQGVKQRALPSARTRVDSGPTAVRGILEALDEEGADLVIMSSHGSTGVLEQAMGAVARDLVRTSKVPVMLVGQSVA